MSNASAYASDIAFTNTVKALQSQRGSRRAYGHMERNGSWETRITPELARFIEMQTSVFLATANLELQPYVQHRGGPPGFLKVLDERTIGFAEFAGNRQYISHGNLADNPKAQIFLLDYASRRRVKIWGSARVIEDDAALVAKLMPTSYGIRADQAILFEVLVWDENCPRHIPQRLDTADVTAALAERDQRITALEAELQRFREQAQDPQSQRRRPLTREAGDDFQADM